MGFLVDFPVMRFSRISDRVLFSPSSHSLKMESDHRRAAADHFRHFKHHLLVWDDHEFLGDCEVVDHCGPRDWDFDVSGFLAGFGESEEFEVRLLDDVVAEGEELAGDWVEFGTGVGYAGAGALIDEPEKPAGVEKEQPCDPRVAVKFPNGLGENRAAQGPFLDEPVGLREPAGVARLAVLELHGVDHPVAVEEVVAGHRLEQRVGAVADVDPPNAFRYCSDHRKRVLDGLLRHRSKIPGNLNARVGRFRQRVLEFALSYLILHRIQGHCRRSLQ
nr:Os07g0154201 [Ipomoea batatas]